MARKAVRAEEKKAAAAGSPAEGAGKEAPKKAAKAPAKKAEIKTSVCVQYLGKEIYEKDMIALVKKAWTAKKNRISDIRSIELYIKPEDHAVYYVVNGDFTGSLEL
ncbi:MAG: DUF6465 family protein [Lachnospiraceae bacterium]|nr:DUF6465 family protein [Lachnospiraceae bacterium]